MRKAEEGSPFCRRHGDAVFGAMLGRLVHGEGMGLRGTERLADSPGRSEDRSLHKNKASATKLEATRGGS